MIAIIVLLVVAVLIFSTWKREKRFQNNLLPWARKAQAILTAAFVAFVFVVLVLMAHSAKGQSNNIYDSSVRPPSRSTENHGYIYYAATHVVYLEDGDGELHAFMSYLCRYNPATHRSQWQLENGRWVEP